MIALQEIWVRADFDIVAARANEAGLPYSRFFYRCALSSTWPLRPSSPLRFFQQRRHRFRLGHPLSSPHPLFFHSSLLAQRPSTPFYRGRLLRWQIGLRSDCSSGGNWIGGCAEFSHVCSWRGGRGSGGRSSGRPSVGVGQDREGEGREGEACPFGSLALSICIPSLADPHFLTQTGDFNSQPYSIIMRILLSHGSLHDAFAATHPPPPSITSSTHRSLSPEQVMHQHGITCDSPLNTYSIPKLAKRGPRDETVIRGGKRLDYVLYRSPLSSGFVMRCEGTDIVLTELVPGLGVSYSDHFGLEATLSFIPTSATSLLSALPPPPPELPTSDLLTLLSTLRTCYSHTSSLSTLQLKFFALSLLLIPLLAFAASYQPLKYVNWIWVLLGIIDGVGGATMLYVGFVGGYWEMGSLRNVMSELENEVGWRRRVEEGGGSRTSDEGWR